MCLGSTRVSYIPHFYPGGDLEEATRLESERIKAWWLADAWAETLMDRQALLCAMLYEFLPVGVSSLLCYCLEGRASAQNRNLIPKALRPKDFCQLLPQGIMTLPVWVMTLVWLALQPEDVTAIEIAFVFMISLWRAACIAMKYAYFAPSDLLRVQESLHWSQTAHNNRHLGAHKFFNAAGTLAFDYLESLFQTAVRTGMLDETRDGFLTVDPETAGQIWNQMRKTLSPDCMERLLTKFAPGSLEWRSKYGDVQGMLGLGDIDKIDAQVAEGKLPVALVAYYFIRSCQLPSWASKMIPVMTFAGCCLGFLHPVVLHLFGQPAFGSSSSSVAVYGIRTFALFTMFLPTFLYLSFPVIDGYKRYQMSSTLLSSFGRGEARAERLVKDEVEDPLFFIESMRDLRAFWCLSRLLGPVHNIGLSYRYNSAFTAVHVGFLCAATGALVASSWSGDVPYGVTAELVALFASGTVAVFMASLMCVWMNAQVSLYVGLARQAALRHPELGSVAKDVCSNLLEEHTVLNPIRILYIPATPALLSLLWSGLVVLTTVFISALPSVCVPLFHFGRGCIN